MNLNKTFLTLGLAAALLQMPASSFAQNAGGNRQNPSGEEQPAFRCS